MNLDKKPIIFKDKREEEEVTKIMKNKRNNKKQEIRLSSLMMITNVALVVWCLCLISYGLVCRNAWVYIFLIVNAVSFYYYANKIVEIVK